MTVKLGMFTMPMHHPDRDYAAFLAEDQEAIILADRLGKDVALEPRQIDPDLLKEVKRALSLSASDIERASHPVKRKVKLKRDGPES